MIRPAEARDHQAILQVVREAFSGPDRDGSEEVAIVSDTWRLGAGIAGLELVAVLDDEAIVGHVLGARGDLGGKDVVAVAPLAVVPARQRHGIGTALMTKLIQEADRQGWPMAVVLGDPRYYGRFGFEPAGPLGVVYAPVGGDDPHFQARRLSAYDPSLQGEVHYCWESPTA